MLRGARPRPAPGASPGLRRYDLCGRCHLGKPTACVFVANGQLLAEQVRSFLQASGVGCILRGESLSKTHGLTLDGLGRVEVLVAEADEDRARGLLASAENGEFRITDDTGADSP